MSISVAASSRLFSHLQKAKPLLKSTYSATVGFIMSGASIMLSAAPFGVAWAGAAAPEQALPSAVGAALGYLVLLRGEGALRYIACLILLLALRWALSFIPKSRVIYYSPLFAAAAVATTGAAIAMMDKGSSYGFIMAFCETAVTATAGILFGKAQRALEENACFAHTNGVCTGIFLAALYMGLSAVEPAGISPAAIFALAAIICCGCFAGTGVSCALAVAAGLAAAISGSPQLLAVYCAGGLASGVFAPLGRLGSCAAASGACLLVYAAQNGFSGITAVFIECAAACLLSAVMPASLLRRLGLARAYDCAEGEMLRQVVVSSLSRSKQALLEISELTGEVSKRLSEIGGDPIESVLARSCAAVCKGCKSSPRCWQTDYETTQDALNHAFSAARNLGQATPGDIPSHFNCERIEKMLSAINAQTSGYMARQSQKRQLAQLRSVSGDQFGGMGELLSSLEQKLNGYCCAPPQTAQAVTRYFASKECEAKSVCCYQNADNRICILVELPSHKAARLLTPQVAADLSELTAQELDKPVHSRSGAVSHIFWSVRPRFEIDSAFLQRAANQNRFCGDSCRVMDKTDDRAVMLLCDGMGVGSPAAVDATMTVSLLERLISSGAGFDCALKLANAALLSGGGEERLCTVDAAILNLYDCRLDIYKAGAAPTYIYQNGRCITVETQSLPAGILSGAEARHTCLSLSEGDIIVMVSDGLLESGGEWLPSQITALSSLPLPEICEQLIQTARQRRLSPREDDMTVIAAKIVAA